MESPLRECESEEHLRRLDIIGYELIDSNSTLDKEWWHYSR